MWVTLLSVMVKEFRQAFRDKRTLVMLLGVPVMQTFVLGFALDLDVDHVPTFVCDQDQTPTSRQLAGEMVASGMLEEVAAGIDPADAERSLETGLAAAAIVIPPGFERDLKRRVPAQVQVLVDGTNPNQAQVAANTASQYLTGKAVELSLSTLAQAMGAQQRVVSLPQVKMEPRVSYNPTLKSSLYMVPGLAAMVLLIVTTLVTAMGLAREREAGTMEQLMVTPIRPAVLLLGKCLPFALVGFLVVGILLTMTSYLFGVPIRGSLWVVAAATALYLMSTLGLGIFASSISHTQQQAALTAFFFVMPAILLSGFLTPVENMPAWIRPITWLNPVRFYLDILRSCLLRAAGWWDLRVQFGALFLFGTGILALSAARFHKRLG